MPSDLNVFVDTNVLLYAQAALPPDKREAAQKWLTWCWQARAGRISTQVLNELYANLRKVAPSLPVADARAVVKLYRGWQVWAVDDSTVDLAWALQDRFPLSYWDALMLAAAQQMGCSVLLTEDLQHLQYFDHVRVVNPFKLLPADLANLNSM